MLEIQDADASITRKPMKRFACFAHKYRVFQKELSKFERVYKCIQRTYTTF
jgi:hypothetical protein